MGKSHSDYTFHDIARLDLSFMKKDKTTEEINKIREQVNYIKTIARNQPKVLHAPYIATFCEQGDKTKPVLNKRSINKCIHEFLDNFSQETDSVAQGQVELLNQAMQAASETIKRNTNEFFKNDLQRSEQDLSSNLSEIQNLEERLNGMIRERKEMLDKHEVLEAKMEKVLSEDLVEYPKVLLEIEKIIAAGHWGFYDSDFDNNIVRIYTRNSINCRYFNPAANIDKSLEFGHFLLEYNYVDKCFRTKRLYNCVMTDRSAIIHPHVTHSDICWGNKSQRVRDLKVNDDLSQVINILNELLLTYCPDNPYATFNSFYRKRNNRGADINVDAIPTHVKQDLGIGE